MRQVPGEAIRASRRTVAACRLQDRFGLRFPLIHASAEQAPFAGASFDLAISEHGASIWRDPYTWIPKAARLLRPGGQLIFLVKSLPPPIAEALAVLGVSYGRGLRALPRCPRPGS